MSKRSGAREVLQAVLDVGTPWTDPDFPPCASSLFHDWSSVPSQELWSKFRWRRSTEFYGKTGPTDLSGKIVPDDISQGALGDCYLLVRPTCN